MLNLLKVSEVFSSNNVIRCRVNCHNVCCSWIIIAVCLLFRVKKFFCYFVVCFILKIEDDDEDDEDEEDDDEFDADNNVADGHE